MRHVQYALKIIIDRLFFYYTIGEEEGMGSQKTRAKTKLIPSSSPIVIAFWFSVNRKEKQNNH
jgi:hypothetical protein